MKLSRNAIVVLALAIPLIIGILARFTPKGEFLEGGREVEEGAFRRTMLYLYLGIGIPILLVIFISKIKKYVRSNHHTKLEPVVIQQGRLNKFDDAWGIYVYAYDPQTISKEYNEPHFTVKVNEKKICSYHIPTIQEWINRKELRLLQGENLSEKDKLNIIRWLDETSPHSNRLTNIQGMRGIWNIYNSENDNAKLIEETK